MITFVGAQSIRRFDYNGESRNFSREATALACPYFMPTGKTENGNWPHPARLPLGGAWTGYCTAPGHQEQKPPQDVLETFCNLGYAGSCRWAPMERIWDAVRFAVKAPAGQGAGSESTIVKNERARVLRMSYVCERDHRPVEYGELEFDISQSSWLKTHSDPRVQKMAECFVESYLRRKA